MDLKNMKMENKLLLISIISGLIAAILAFYYFSNLENNIKEKMEPVKVIAAARYIPSYTRLEKEMLKTIEIPKKMVNKANVVDLEKIEGKITLVPFIEDEPILENKLSRKGNELNIMISTGLRAISISVDEESGVGFMIRPGDYVDVLLTFQDIDPITGKGTLKTATILQDIKVIATGTEFSLDKKNTNYSSITLALMPEEAELVTFAKEKGKISFALRALGDRTKEKIKPISFVDLMQQIKSYEKKEYINQNKKNNTDSYEIQKRGEE
ncbi:MAG: Flp pilus assembly protein CpaB [Candidatus Goldbacteria bacterium]|nr:Flp pilus assembly protein CpaB [Candidatus Goldiibacteriota bacterium]